MKKHKKLMALIGACSLAIAGVGCSTNTAPQQSQEIKKETETITVTHMYGEAVVPKNPSSVAVFDFGILDTLQKLGVESITGVPQDTTSRPEYLAEYGTDAYVNVGGLKEADFEELYELQPEIILISGRLAPSYEELSKIAPVIYMELDKADYMGSLKKNVAILAEIFGKEGEAEQYISEIEETVEQINKVVTANATNALITMVNKGEVSVYGEVSRFGMLHNALGFEPADESIDDSTHGQSVTFEYLAKVNPDYLFVIDRNAIDNASGTAKDTLDNAIVNNMEVTKGDRIIYLDPIAWYITPGGLTASQVMVDEVAAALGLE